MRAASLAFALLLACGTSGPVAPSVGVPDGGPPPIGPPPPEVPPAPFAKLAGCPLFGPDSEWNRDVSRDPVDPYSDEYLQFMLARSMRLQPDFGVAPYGQPVHVVPGTQPRVPISFRYAAESDPGPYPFPPDLALQDNEDRHAIVVDRDGCKVYESYVTYPDGQGGFRADSGAVFDLRSSALRPDGWTAATASGLPMVAGMVRYDEATGAGEILHALAIIAGPTAPAYVHPATHSSGTSTAPFAPPMGMRLRLKASYDLAGYRGASLAVLRAMKRYGMFVVDNSSGLPFWAVPGEQDSRWDMADLDQLKTVPASAFEVVKLGTVRRGL